MKRKILLIVVFLSIIIAVVFVKPPAEKQNQVCFKNYCFKVELAKTAEEISRGLMFRKTLDSDRGMLFVFEKEGNYYFWMKNTLIPLDIIWINKDNEVVFISDETKPCEEEYSCPSVNPDKNAKYVLELNGGTAKKIGLGAGDKIELSELK